MALEFSVATKIKLASASGEVCFVFTELLVRARHLQERAGRRIVQGLPGNQDTGDGRQAGGSLSVF